MEITTFRAKIMFPQLFRPARLDSGRDVFSICACVDKDEESRLPSWVEVKDSNWRSGGAPARYVQVSSNFPVPTFGLSPDWIARTRAMNIGPDRFLVNATCDVAISRSTKTDSRSGLERTFCNPVAVRFGYEPELPDFVDFVERERNK